MKKVLLTGANGFIGKNLQLHLSKREDIEIVPFTREHQESRLPDLLKDIDFIFHLAGINRPQDPQDFFIGNRDLTNNLCNAIRQSKRNMPVIYTSSIQAHQNNPYGTSKRAAEDALFSLQATQNVPVHIFRLPNVFGKWCKPHYNSAVATFCYNIARGAPIHIHDPNTPLLLVYVDDVIEGFIRLMDGATADPDQSGFEQIRPQYSTTVGILAEQIKAFRESRTMLTTDRVGAGFVRALYATYISYLPTEDFVYPIPQHSDPRGVFVEVLKTPDCGQFSYFTAHPGVTRGGHYHHSKTEKFLVIKGKARFKFRHMNTGETFELETDGSKAEIVETVPGWAHDITNIGDDEMIVMLWANEIFDRAKPDTFTYPL